MNVESNGLIDIITESDITLDDVYHVQQLQAQFERVRELMPLCKFIVTQAIYEMSLLDKEVTSE